MAPLLMCDAYETVRHCHMQAAETYFEAYLEGKKNPNLIVGCHENRDSLSTSFSDVLHQKEGKLTISQERKLPH